MAPPEGGGPMPLPGGSGAPAGELAPVPRAARRLEDLVGAAAMALLALITLANVLVRYFTDESFAWTEEISVALMVVLTLAATGAAVARDRHIRIEMLFGGGSARRRRRLAMLSALATVAVFVALAALGARLAWDDFRYEVSSPGIGVPQWWYTVWLPVLAALVAARAMQVFVSAWLRR